MKLKAFGQQPGDIEGYSFYCPGCDAAHSFYIKGSKTWTFNGDMSHPTVMPSLKMAAPDHGDPAKRCCHLVLLEGKLHFANDCTHALKGQVIELPDYPFMRG